MTSTVDNYHPQQKIKKIRLYYTHQKLSPEVSDKIDLALEWMSCWSLGTVEDYWFLPNVPRNRYLTRNKEAVCFLARFGGIGTLHSTKWPPAAPSSRAKVTLPLRQKNNPSQQCQPTLHCTTVYIFQCTQTQRCHSSFIQIFIKLIMLEQRLCTCKYIKYTVPKSCH